MRQAPIGPSFKLRHGCDCPLPLPRFGLNSSTGRAPQATAGCFASMSGSGGRTDLLGGRSDFSVLTHLRRSDTGPLCCNYSRALLLCSILVRLI